MNFQIAFIISVMGLFITMPLFARYFAFTNLPLWAKIAGFLFCILTAVLPIFASRDWTKTYGAYFAYVEYTLYFIYIFAVILFSLTLFRDVIWFVLSMFKAVLHPFHTHTVSVINFVTVVIAFICAIWSLYEGIRVPAYRHITLTSPKITTQKTIAVLSDLHISRTVNPQKIQDIVERTNAINPDIILLPGDIVDDDVNIIKPTTRLLSDLRAKEGIFFVSGNHEFYIGYQSAMQAIKNLGFTSVENKQVQLAPNFYVVGISDIPTTRRLTGKTLDVPLFKGIPETAYTLFMSHTPTPLNDPFDLQVAGHTHGGQIFPFHIFSWAGNHHLLAGFYPKDRIYVSRGSGQWGPQMRFLAPSEITVIHLTPADNTAASTTK